MKRMISAMVMLICVVAFAMEMYVLSFLHAIDIMSGKLNGSVMDYAVKAPYSIIIMGTIAVFAFSQWTFFSERKNMLS